MVIDNCSCVFNWGSSKQNGKPCIGSVQDGGETTLQVLCPCVGLVSGLV